MLCAKIGGEKRRFSMIEGTSVAPDIIEQVHREAAGKKASLFA
jgi:cephalosporin hydroxylase